MSPLDDTLERLRQEARDDPEAPAPAALPWAGRAQASVSQTQALLEALAGQPRVPYRTLLILDEDDFLRLAYRLLLGRTPDPSGLAHYRQRLAQGETRAEVLMRLAGSPEARLGRRRVGSPRWAALLVTAKRLTPAPLSHLPAGAARVLERRLTARAAGTALALQWRLARQLDAQQAASEAQTAAALTDMSARLETAQTALDARHAALMQAQAEQAHALTQGLDEVRAHLTHAQARLAALSLPVPARSEPAPDSPADADPAPLDQFYYAFESVFRGAPDRIEAQLRTDYLHWVERARAEAGNGPCLDLGSGRGEWLRVLGEAGLEASGVDLSPVMVAAAQARGARASLADALDAVRAAEPDSLLLISAFHLVEHLPFPTLFALLAACRRALRPEGLLILETPNPENVWVATHTFHHDPTHGQPLTPTMLGFLARHHGLQVAETPRLHPYPETSRLPDEGPAAQRLNGMLCGPQDFALIARKPRVPSGAWSDDPACA